MNDQTFRRIDNVLAVVSLLSAFYRLYRRLRAQRDKGE